MGTYIKESYGDSVYSIGFSTINGEIDYSKSKDVQYLFTIEPEEQSIEKQLIDLKISYPYLDFSEKKEVLPDSLFNGNMTTNILDGTSTIGNLSDFFDGVLFIKGAKPITYIKKKVD